MSAIIGIAALGSFTFHYVSINTLVTAFITKYYKTFTFHYVSINTGPCGPVGPVAPFFTFHYVSINTECSDTISHFVCFLYIPLCFY